jgi:hypothetical protein
VVVILAAWPTTGDMARFQERVRLVAAITGELDK